MRNLTRVLAIPTVSVCMMMMIISCSKEDQITPAKTVQPTPSEILEKQINPSVYIVTRFIDNGQDQTAEFNGYTFQFFANGGLLASFGETNVTGTWSLDSTETVLSIDISGTGNLNDIDDDNWNVIRITNNGFRIQKSGPDVVIFHKQ